MRTITISDIAKKANVSIGTVSNVLNRKGNVKIETIRKVELAANELGYVRNPNATSIRKKDSIYVALVVPFINDETSSLISRLYVELKNNRLELKIFETLLNEQKELNFIKEIKQGNYRAIVFINSITSPDKINKMLKSKKDDIVWIGKKQNYFKQLNINFKYFLQEFAKENNIVIANEKEDSFGITEYLRDNINKQQNPSFIDNSNESLYINIRRFHKNTFICCSKKTSNRIATIARNLGLTSPKIIMISTERIDFFEENSKVTTFHFSTNEMSLKILKLILVKSKNQSSENIKVYQTNLKTFSTINEINNKKEINILMVDNPFSEVLKKIIGNFIKTYNININVYVQNLKELKSMLEDDRIKKYDLIRLDISDFPWYGKSVLQPLPDLENLGPIIERFTKWKNYINIGETAYGIPLDPSIQMMLYRKDFFNNPIIQKTYSKTFGKELTIPKSFEELNNISIFINKTDLPENNINYALPMVEKNGVLIASEFLPYYHSLGGKIKYSNGIFHFNTEIFITSLDLYRKNKSINKIIDTTWWNSEIESFNNNETILLIGYLNHLNSVTVKDYGYASIPGNSPMMGGGVIGVSKYTKQVNHCLLFLKWLYQYQTQHEIALLGGVVPSTDIFYDLDIYKKYPYLSYAVDLNKTGHRYNLTNNNEPINTILFEEFIGNEIYNGELKKLSSSEILLNVNNKLIMNIDTLVKK